MILTNNTPLAAGFTLGMGPDGRESVVVVIKAGFSIPHIARQVPTLLDEQPLLVEADTFSGEPGHSSPLYESDYALFKPRCDVSLIASAYAPGGKPTERVQTGFRIAGVSKLVDVLGERQWVANTHGISISSPTLFDVRPITYELAFGGTDRAHDDPRLHDAYAFNPVGIGYHKAIDDTLLNGSAAPSTEEAGVPATHPHQLLRPMSFGPLARGWQPRIGLAGTYDDEWLDQRFPFLPDDFDQRYHQSVPEDQQCDYLRGGEEVRLVNLTPAGRCRFQIPGIAISVGFLTRKSRRTEKKAVIDTLIIEPDEHRFTLTWRTQLPLERNLFEIPEIVIGLTGDKPWGSRSNGRVPAAEESDRHADSERDFT